MKAILIPFYLIFIALGQILLSSCKDIIEPSISNSHVTPEAPAEGYISSSYTISFWWDQVPNAISYHLQVVSPTFISPGYLVLDTVVSANKFYFNLTPGNYQWRVMAENGSSQTVYTTPKDFIVNNSPLTQQAVQLNSPANNTLTNQSYVVLQWGSLYGVTSYQLQIDTNNFADTTQLVANKTMPSLQFTFTFPKNQTYQWRVRAQNDTAQSKWSIINKLTYDNIPPSQVQLLLPDSGQTISIPVSLQWNAALTAINYKLYVYKSDSTTVYSTNFPLLLNNLNYSFDFGNSGDKVYWKVSAIDAAGNEGQASKLRSFVLQ